MNRTLLSIAAILAFVLPGSAQQIPHTEATALTGAPIVVPVPSGTKPLLVLIAFSHKGGDEIAAWNKKFKTVYETDPRIDYVELADFEGVPSFIMTMILHGMRRSVHEPESSHLAPFFSQDDAWKKLVAFKDSSIAYVVLADPTGHVLWQTTGPPTDEKAAELETAVAAAASH